MNRNLELQRKVKEIVDFQISCIPCSAYQQTCCLRCNFQVSHLETELEESRRQVKRLSVPSAPTEVNITTEDLRAILISNPHLIDIETWKTLSRRSGAVKSVVGDLGGEEGGNQGEKAALGGEKGNQGEKAALGGEGGSQGGMAAEQTEGVFKCEQSKRCRRKFKSLKGLEKHVKEYHQGKKNFVCTDCGRQFMTLKMLKKHEKIHIKPEVACTICGVEKRDAYQLKRHMDQQHEEGRGICHKCNVDFGTRAALRKHFKSCGRKKKADGNMQVTSLKLIQ